MALQEKDLHSHSLQDDSHLPSPPTLEEDMVMTRKGLSRKLMAASLISYMAAFNFGYNNAIIGSTLGQANFYKYFTEIDPTTTHGSALIGCIVAMVSAGGAIGVLFNSFIIHHYGRKAGFISVALLTLLGVGLLSGSRNLVMLNFGRMISGFGAWAGMNVGIIYVQELAPSGYRGEFGVGMGPALNLAYFLASWVQVGFFYVTLSINWRIPLIIGAVWASILLVATFFVPESPRWLIWNGRSEEAMRIFEDFHYDPKDPEHLLAREEHFQVSKQVELDKTLPASWIAMFTRYRRRTLAAMLVTFNNQVGGIQVVTNYGPTIYASAGLTGGMPLIIAGCWYIWANISAIIWATQVDRVGRKPLLVWQAICCALVFSMVIGLYAAYDTNAATAHNLKAGQSALIFSFFLYVFVYEMGEPIMFLYIGEIFPQHIRPKGVALGLFSLNVTAAWVTMAFPPGVLAGGYKFLFLFWGCLIICAGLQQIMLRESRRVPLEEMAAIWGNPDEVAIFSKDIHLNMLEPGHVDHHGHTSKV